GLFSFILSGFWVGAGQDWTAPAIEVDGKLADCKWQSGLRGGPARGRTEPGGLRLRVRLRLRGQTCQKGKDRRQCECDKRPPFLSSRGGEGVPCSGCIHLAEARC